MLAIAGGQGLKTDALPQCKLKHLWRKKEREREREKERERERGREKYEKY